MEQEKRYLKRWQYLTVGGGNAGMVLTANLISNFYILFATDYMGLNSVLIGTLMLIAKLFDGITDLIFGVIMDRSTSRLGKARPWIFRSAIPLSLCCIMLFFIPSKGSVMPYVYFFIFYTVYNAVFYTMANLSYNTLSALVTRSDSERVEMGVFSYFTVVVANVAITAFTLNCVKALGGNATAWRVVSAIFSIIGAVLLMISAATVKELPPEESAQKEEKNEKLGVKEGLKIVVHNPYYFWCILANIVNAMVLAALSNLSLYFCKINLHNLDLYSLLGSVGVVFMIPGLLIAPTMVKKLGLWKCNIISCALLLLSGNDTTPHTDSLHFQNSNFQFYKMHQKSQYIVY